MMPTGALSRQRGRPSGLIGHPDWSSWDRPRECARYGHRAEVIGKAKVPGPPNLEKVIDHPNV
eukprot:12454853-Heterocapsa_arctica.AAC.1